MKSPSLLRITVLAALLTPLLPVIQAAETYTIDPAHSSVSFEVRHFITKVPGRFNEFSGTIDYDPADPSKSATSVTIQVASVDTANAKRDTHLKDADFFDAGKYPVITFKCKSVEPTGEKRAKITGDLTIKDVTKEVVLDAEFLGEAKGMMGETRTGWEGSTKISRKEFNVAWSKVVEGAAVVGDEVGIKLEIAAVKK